MIRFEFNIYVDGAHSLALKRLDCVFKGHNWTQWYRINKSGQPQGEREEWTACSHCHKRRGGDKP